MKKIFKALLLAVICAMLASVALVGVAAEGGDAALTNPIAYDGMSARVKTDAPGLRSTYRVDLDMVKAWENAGYTVEYGAIMAGEKKTIFDPVSNTPDDLRVTKTASGFTASVEGGAQKAQPVCVYSSTGASYATGVYTFYGENEAGYAFTGVFRPDQQNRTYYSFGFIYAGFFYAEKAGEEPIVMYTVPEATEGEFFVDQKCTLLEVSQHWAAQTGSSYAKNKNILNVVRSQQSEGYAPEIADGTLTVAAGETYTMQLSNMKAGIYAVKLTGTAAASEKYTAVAFNGDASVQKLSSEFSGVFVYAYLTEGDNTVSITSVTTLTLSDISFELVKQIAPENVGEYSSIALQGAKQVHEGAELLTTKPGSYKVLRMQTTSTKAAVDLDVSAAGRYSVVVLYAGAGTLEADLVEGGTTLSKTLASAGDGSTGAGASYAVLGALDFEAGVNTLYLNKSSGNYVNIGSILLVRESHTVTVKNYDGKLLSVQEVYDGEYAASTNVTSVPAGYELLDKVAFSSFPITEDTVIYPNARRTDALSATIDGTTLTVEGATEGYYDITVNVTGTFAKSNYVRVTANGATYAERYTDYEKNPNATVDLTMTVFLKGGTNTLNVTNTNVTGLLVNSAVLTNVQHTYGAVRVAATEVDKEASTFGSSQGSSGISENLLHLRSGNEAVWTSVNFPTTGYYFVFSAGATNAEDLVISVGDTEVTVNAAKVTGGASNVTHLHNFTNNLIYVEAGVYDVKISGTTFFSLFDALVFAPHLVCIPEAEYTVDVEPTCNKDGSKSYHCTVCGESIEETAVSIPADNDLHVGDWELLASPTDGKNGAAKVNCTVCGNVITMDILPEATGTPVDTESITVVDGSTVKVDAPVAGIYKVTLTASNKSTYYKLTNTTFDSNSFTYDKAKREYALYLCKGENTLVYGGSDIEAATVELITAADAAAHSTRLTEKGLIPEYTANCENAGTLSIKRDGIYRISAFVAMYNGATLQIKLTHTDSTSITIDADLAELILKPGSSSNSAGYDEFDLVYLKAGDWTMDFIVTGGGSKKVHVGTVFALTVDIADHVCTEFDEVETLAPTCNEEGVMTEVCVLCDKVNSERPIPATGEHIGEWSVTTEPTCDTEGVNSCICTVCGEVTSTEAIAAKGHTGEWVVTKEMTATEDGLMKQLCGECGKTTFKTMKNPYIIQIDNDSVTVGEVSGNNVIVTTDVAGWYEIEILGNGGSGSYYKLYNETLNDTNVYTYQKETYAAENGFAIYLLAGVHNVLNYNGPWTGVNVNLLAAHAYEDYATSGHKSLALATGTATYTITVKTDGYYILGGTSKLQDAGSYLHLDIVGEDVEIPLDHYFENPLTTAEGSNGSLGYDEFGMVYLTAGTYTVTATNPKAIKDNNTASNTHRVYIGSLFVYAIEQGEHIHSAETTSEITTPPTCNEAGERTYYCVDCGEAVRTEVVNATGVHDGEWTIVMPTVDAEGSATMTCSCGETLNKILAPLTDVADAEAIEATVAGEGGAFTFAVTAPKAGFYLVNIATAEEGTYHTLTANGFASKSKGKQTDGFSAYLVAGENTLTYDGPTATAATVKLVTEVTGTMASATASNKGNVFAVGSSGSASIGTNADMTTTLTITEDGFYRLAGFTKATVNGNVVLTFTNAYGIATAHTIAIKTDAVIDTNGSASAGYDTYDIVYLERGVYTVNVANNGGQFVITSLFAIPVVATDATPAE